MVKDVSNLKLIFIGITLGGLVFFKPILLLLALLLGVMAIFLSRVNPADRTMLTRIVLIGLALRLLFSFISLCYIPIPYIDYAKYPVLTNVIGHSVQLFRDFQREILNGVNLGRYFAGEYGDALLREILSDVAVEGKTTFLHLGSYIQGVLNFIFGESLLNILVYPLFGIWAIVLVYYLAKEVFNRNVAIPASFIIAVLPSFIVWSCINIRMTIAIISTLLICWSLIKFKKRNHIKYLIPFFIALLAVGVAKSKFAEPMRLISIFILFLGINFNRRIKNISVILILATGLMLVMNNSTARSKVRDLSIRIITNQKSFYLYASGNNYKIYEDFVYTEDLERIRNFKIVMTTLLKGLPKGASYFLFAPFPWQVTNTLRLYSYPQILFWYFIFPFSIWGILIGLRYNLTDTLFLLSISLFWIVLLSLTMGNEGTAARHRDLISPFFYIFASAALCNLVGALKR